MIAILVLLAFSNSNSVTKANEENDYINGLPSEERYEFIKTVARRIVAEVTPTGTPPASEIEIPDSELGKSTEYVNKVLKEEISKLKARKTNKNIPKRTNVTRPEDRDDKWLNFTFRTDFNEEMKDHIDLTSAKKRKSRDPANEENLKAETIKVVRKRQITKVPVKIVFDKPIGSKRSERRSWDQNDDFVYDRKDVNTGLSTEDYHEDNSPEKKVTKLNLNDDNAKLLESTEPKELDRDREELVKSSEEGHSRNTNFDDVDTNYTTGGTYNLTSTDVVIMTTDASTTETPPPQFDDATFVVHPDNNTFPTTERLIDTTTVLSDTASTVKQFLTTVPTKEEPEKPNLKSLELKSVDTVSNAEEPQSTGVSNKTSENSVASVPTVVLTKESTVSGSKILEKHTTLGPKSTVSTTEEPQSTVVITEESQSAVASAQNHQSTVHITEEPKSTVVTTLEHKGPAVKAVLRTSIISEEDYGGNVVYKADKLLRTVGKTTEATLHFGTLFKAVPKLTKKVRIQEKGEDKIVPSKTHPHGILYYRVYEVDPALDPFKLRTGADSNNDQPYYAPVYNYEPRSAYFNPYNRQGPNLRDDDVDDRDTHNKGQAGLRELRSNNDQQPYVPVYNYEPINAYYNPQNRLGPNDDNIEEELFHKQAGVKSAARTGHTKDQIDVDYYYARNEAIQDSIESRKFRFKGIPAMSDLRKPSVKDSPLQQTSYFIFATTQRPESHNRDQENGDYVDYYYGRKDGKNSKGRTTNGIYINLNQYYGKSKKVSLAKSRLQNPFNEYNSKDKRNKQRPQEGKPISMDYYYAIDDPGAVLYKLKPVQKVKLPSSKGVPFRYRATVNNAIDLDYYFDRKEGKNGDEDISDFVDGGNIDTDSVTSRKWPEKYVAIADDAKSFRHDNLETYTRVLKDMFEMESGVLVKYDWLGTTVNIRAALAKLIDLFDAQEQGEVINAHDNEILTYLVRMYWEATGDLQIKDMPIECTRRNSPLLVIDPLRSKKRMLPKNEKMMPGQHIKNPFKLIRDVYMRLMRSCATAERKAKRILFREFLEGLQDALYDFHTAIKHIASVTRFDKQNWFQNIKDLYLSEPKTNSKELLQVLAHLVTMEIFQRVEESSKNGLEEDSARYRKEHPREFDETTKELQFVMRLLKEINKFHSY